MCDSARCEQACFVAWVTRLVRAERPRLAAAARDEGLGDAEALDAVQEGLITFRGLPGAAALGAGHEDRDAARLLAAVVRNAARNQRRRHHRARPHDGDLGGVASDDRDDAVHRIARAEERLAMSA